MRNTAPGITYIPVMRRFLARAVLAQALALAATASAQAQAPTSLRPAIEARYPDVSWVDTAQLDRWLRDEERRTLLLDARTRAEYDVRHLRGAVRVDPDLADPGQLSLPRDARIVIYCAVGWRSGALADRFRRAGFEDVHNLEGGLFQWANEGRPVYRDGERVREVHPYDRVWGRFLDAELRSR